MEDRLQDFITRNILPSLERVKRNRKTAIVYWLLFIALFFVFKSNVLASYSDWVILIIRALYTTAFLFAAWYSYNSSHDVSDPEVLKIHKCEIIGKGVRKISKHSMEVKDLRIYGYFSYNASERKCYYFEMKDLETGRIVKLPKKRSVVIPGKDYIPIDKDTYSKYTEGDIVEFVTDGRTFSVPLEVDYPQRKHYFYRIP